MEALTLAAGEDHGENAHGRSLSVRNKNYQEKNKKMIAGSENTVKQRRRRWIEKNKKSQKKGVATEPSGERSVESRRVGSTNFHFDGPVLQDR